MAFIYRTWSAFWTGVADAVSKLKQWCKSHWKILTFVVLSTLSIFLILPIPWTTKNLSEGQYINPKKDPVEFVVRPYRFEPIIESVSDLIGTSWANNGYYDLYIKNTSNYVWTLTLSFHENDPLIPYLTRTLGVPTDGIDGHPGFAFKTGTYRIKGIPQSIKVVDALGIFGTCGDFELLTKCPDEPWESPMTYEIFARPNISYWLFQVFLICAFWIVVMNSALEFFLKRRQ